VIIFKIYVSLCLVLDQRFQLAGKFIHPWQKVSTYLSKKRSRITSRPLFW